MNSSSTVRRRDSSTEGSRRRRAAGNRLTAILARLEREVMGTAENYVFGALNEFRAEVACSAAGRRRALALLPQSGPSTVHDLLPGTTVFTAEKFGAAVGTVSVFTDGPLGLPLDVSCRRLLDPIRCSARRLVEIGDLAVSRELEAPAARTVAMHLIKLAYLTARYQETATDLVAAALPRHARFARRFLFRPMSGEWAGVLPLRLDIWQSELSFLGQYAGRPGDRDLDAFLRNDEEPALDWIRKERRALPEEDLLALLEERREVYARLPIETRHAFEDTYLAYDIGRVLSGD